jgi:hypothetical protein
MHAYMHVLRHTTLHYMWHLSKHMRISVDVHAYEEDRLLSYAPCSLAEVDRRFRAAYCIHHYEIRGSIAQVI